MTTPDAALGDSTEADGTRTITVDQFVARPPAAVWRALTEPDLLARWWAASDVAAIVGHRFTLDMGPWGPAPCEVLEVVEHERFVYSFTERWTLTWTLVAEGAGTRVLLEHAGFDLDDPQHRHAFEMMGPGWRDDVLPRLAGVAETL
jgi:uncharacterized protein YndB with AHSA1/START domain